MINGAAHKPAEQHALDVDVAERRALITTSPIPI
jgi:hypothetical protein